MRQAISVVGLTLILATPTAALECTEVPQETLLKREEIVLLG
jgi:hypothetical protein